jgi:hypothetical protein
LHFYKVRIFFFRKYKKIPPRLLRHGGIFKHNEPTISRKKYR